MIYFSIRAMYIPNFSGLVNYTLRSVAMQQCSFMVFKLTHIIFLRGGENKCVNISWHKTYYRISSLLIFSLVCKYVCSTYIWFIFCILSWDSVAKTMLSEYRSALMLCTDTGKEVHSSTSPLLHFYYSAI